MANYATLISAIQSVITENGNNEITGPILQQTLVSIINSLGSGYQFIGIATPSTTPGTPDQKVFYIGASGTYPNFGPAVIPDGNLAVFYYDSSWHYGTVAFPIGDGAVTTPKLANKSVTIEKLADIKETTLQAENRQTGAYLKADGTIETDGVGASAIVDKFIISNPSGRFLVSGRVPRSSNYATIAFYNSSDVFISSALIGDGVAARNYEDYEITLPENTGIVRVLGNSNYIYPALKSTISLPEILEYLQENEENLSDEINESTNIISQIVLQNRQTGAYLKADGTLMTDGIGASAIVGTFWVPVSLRKFLVSGRASSSSNLAMVAFYNASGVFLSSALVGDGTTKTYENYEIIAPENTGIIKVQGNSNYIEPSLKYVKGVKKSIEELQNIVDVFPKIEYGSFLVASGYFTEMQAAAGGNNNVYGQAVIRTPKYIRCKSENAKITTNINLQCRVWYYDKNYNFLRVSDWIDLTAGIEKDITLFIPGQKAEFIRLNFRGNSQLPNIPLFILKLSGWFEKEFEYKNIRSADSGYQTVAVLVDIINAAASNTETNSVQDTPNYKYDYGLLVLPQTYSNNGKPTRLIIYCHGAGVNYPYNTSRFPTTDLLPDFWLSEGYAILDMDGEFYDSEHQHAYIPEARQSYLAAYRWVTENYNICKDGIFLGGRSMGGGMCFDLMECNDIPVIAACPVVPVCNTLWWWNYMPKQYRQDSAQKLGFTGTAPTWTDNNPMTQNEWNYLYANFEKMVKYSQLWRCILDLPGKETLFNGMRISSEQITGEAVEAEAAIYSNLHAKVKAPVKFFDCYTDPTVPYSRNALLMYKMLINAAQICELRMFDTAADSDTSISAHHFELRTDRLVQWTNTYGETLQNVPVVYIEMMQFWRRYEYVNGH